MRKKIFVPLLLVASLFAGEQQDYKTCKRVINLSNEIYSVKKDGDRIAWCDNSQDSKIMFTEGTKGTSKALTQLYGKNNWQGWLINYNRFLCFAQAQFPDTKNLNGLLSRLEIFFTYRITKDGAKNLASLPAEQQKLSGFFAMNDPRVEDNMINGFNVLHRIYMGHDYAYKDPEIDKFVELIGNGDIQGAWQLVLKSDRTNRNLVLPYCANLEKKFGSYRQ